jgi:hypothetical protein
LLKIDRNQQRVDDSEQCIAIFNRNKDEFFRRYITMDVKWLLHNTSEFNRQSAELTERDEPNPKCGKTQRSAGISITACTRGIIFIDYLEKGQNINNEYYMALLERLNDEIMKKRPHLKKVLFHQDNRLCHKSIKTTAKLHELGYELLPHSPYPRDLASSDLFLFADLKKMLAGKKSSTNQEVIVEN